MGRGRGRSRSCWRRWRDREVLNLLGSRRAVVGTPFCLGYTKIHPAQYCRKGAPLLLWTSRSSVCFR